MFNINSIIHKLNKQQHPNHKQSQIYFRFQIMVEAKFVKNQKINRKKSLLRNQTQSMKIQVSNNFQTKKIKKKNYKIKITKTIWVRKQMIQKMFSK